MSASTTALAALSFLASSWVLRRAWLSPQWRRAHAAASLVLCLLGSALAVRAAGAEIGVPIAVAMFSTAAIVVLALGRTVRPRAARRDTAPPREASQTRGAFPYAATMRLLLSVIATVPLAIAIGAACAVLLPFEPQTRTVVAAYIMPLAWAAAMAWAISATRVKTVLAAGIAVVLACAAVVVPRLLGGA